MSSVNKVHLLGNLGDAPKNELRALPSGTVTTVMSVATNRVYTNKEGEKVTDTEWHRVAVYGTNAENAAEYLDKGQSVYVEGRLRTRKWEDKEGVTRYTTEVVAERIVYLNRPGGQTGTEEPFTEDDLPEGVN